MYLNRRSEMKNFSHEKAKGKSSDWRSPAMYTHVCEYKFCIGVDANGYGSECGKSIRMDLYSMSQEFDDQLKWPAKARFTVELINQTGGENGRHSRTLIWKKLINQSFLEHYKLNSFFKNDTLYFYVSEVKLF